MDTLGEDDCKDDGSMERLNKLVKLGNDYQMITENSKLRCNLGIIMSEASLPNY